MRLMKLRKANFSFDFDAFKVEFYVSRKRVEDCRMTIHAKDGTYSAVYTGGTQVFRDLLIDAAADRRGNIEGFCYYTYVASNYLTCDQAFIDGVRKQITAATARLLKQSKKEAKEVTPEQEAASDALMREAIEYGSMSAKERKKRKEEMRQEFRELISNESNESNGENGDSGENDKGSKGSEGNDGNEGNEGNDVD